MHLNPDSNVAAWHTVYSCYGQTKRYIQIMHYVSLYNTATNLIVNILKTKGLRDTPKYMLYGKWHWNITVYDSTSCCQVYIVKVCFKYIQLNYFTKVYNLVHTASLQSHPFTYRDIDNQQDKNQRRRRNNKKKQMISYSKYWLLKYWGL